MAIVANASGGQSCSRGIFSFVDAACATSAAVSMTRTPPPSAKHVTPYLLEHATCLAYPLGAGNAAQSSRSSNARVPTAWNTSWPTSGSATPWRVDIPRPPRRRAPSASRFGLDDGPPRSFRRDLESRRLPGDRARAVAYASRGSRGFEQRDLRSAVLPRKLHPADALFPPARRERDEEGTR